MLHLQVRKTKHRFKKNRTLRLVIYKDHRFFKTLGVIQARQLFYINHSRQIYIKFLYFDIGMYAYYKEQHFKIPFWLHRIVPFSLFDSLLLHNIFLFYRNSLIRLVKKSDSLI